MRALVLAAACVGVVGLAAVARADDRDDARREFTDGQAADKAGDFAAAIQHYEIAYRLIPHPNAAYNIAFDNEQLHNYREAAKWYQLFLALAPGSPDAGRVRILVVELAHKPGPLTVTSNPSGVRVLIDGRVLATPATLSVRGGNHLVVLEHDNQRDARTVHTEFGEPQTFAVDGGQGGPDAQGGQGVQGGQGMPGGQGQGTLLVYGSPPGATVYVDDQPAGNLPAQLQVAPGKHTVRVQQPGFSDAFATVDVAPTGVTREQIELSRGISGSTATPGPGGPSGPGGPGSTVPNPQTPTGPLFGYLLGVSGGVDARTADAAYTADIGVRLARWELLAQIGQAEGGTYFNFALRASLTTGRFAPFLGASYELLENAGGNDNTSSSGGFSGLAGVRWDFSRSDRLTLTARATVGIGYFNVTTTNPTTEAMTTSTQIAVPVTLSLEATIGRTQ
jgi:hypothetical protein